MNLLGRVKNYVDSGIHPGESDGFTLDERCLDKPRPALLTQKQPLDQGFILHLPTSASLFSGTSVEVNPQAFNLITIDNALLHGWSFLCSYCH